MAWSSPKIGIPFPYHKDLHWHLIFRRGCFSKYCEYLKYIDVKIAEHYPIVILGIILTRRHGRAAGQNCINFKIV